MQAVRVKSCEILVANERMSCPTGETFQISAMVGEVRDREAAFRGGNKMMKNATVESMVVEDSKEPEKPIDREKTCPLLLRVFCNTGRHHPLSEYLRGQTPSNELQIYTWMDATLKELTGLVKEVNPDARRKGTYFDFAMVYPDLRQQMYRLQEIGTTCSGHRGADDNVTLASKKFTIGDYLDIAISPPRSGPLPMSRRGRPY